MKIGFCGTMSIGKTTLVKALAQLPEFKDYHISTERSKYLRDLGIPLNTDSTINGQIIFAAERASELLHENLITDRTCWDVASFTALAKSIDTYSKYSILKTLFLLKDQYDVVFYISPEGIPIEDNGVRTVDPQYRSDINSKILDFLGTEPPKNLYYISGSTEERIEQIKEHLTTL